MRQVQSICLAVLASVSLSISAPAAELTKGPLSKIKQDIVDQKAVLVDVREKNEWDNGHIEGAIFLPLSVLQRGVKKDDLKALPKDKILYVHCVVGKRALTAGNILERNGYNVQPIKSGYKEMISGGFSKGKE